MRIKPLNDKVVVRFAPPAERTRGGIIIPPSAGKDEVHRGTVVAVGPGRLLDNGSRSGMSVTKGEEVLFSRYSGTQLKLNGNDHVVLPEDQILGVLDEEDLD